MKCQFCNTPYDHTEERKKWSELKIPYSMTPDRYSCCSFQCLENSIRFNSAWKLREFSRNFDLKIIGLDEFAKAFGFSKDGGYAEEKYKQARVHPWSFLCGLSQDKFMLLVKSFLLEGSR